MSKKTHVALFAGLGGFIVATDKCGYKTVFANDCDQACVGTLESTFPKLRVSATDVTKLSVDEELSGVGPIDLLSAGFPCQPFSGAGSNKGFSDPRGELFREITRICNELPEPPKVLLLENVSHLKIFENGARLSIILNDLRVAGYWVSDTHAMIVNSKDLCGSPQNRERLFVVAYHSKYFKKNYFDTNITTSKEKTPLWNLIDRNKKVDDMYYLHEGNKYFQKIRKASEKSGKNRIYQIRRVEVRGCPENTCPTLTANMGGGGHNVPFVIDKFGIRKLTESECLSLQGYDAGDIIFPDDLMGAQKYTMIGNAIYPEIAQKIIEKIDFSKMKKEEKKK